MPGRPVDQQRRDEILDGVVEYAVEHGSAALTWRPVASALGMSTTALVHRFGSKEGMVQAVQARLRERTIVETASGEADDLAALARRVWERVADPARTGEFRLFFDVYGQALVNTDLYADFLDHAVTDALSSFGDTPAATLALAAVRGLLLDLLTTGERERVDAAAAFLFAQLAGIREPRSTSGSANRST